MRLHPQILIILFNLLTCILCGQPTILDPCFSSGTPGTSFASVTNLADVGNNSDLCQWTGSAWTGGWPGASLTKVPPVNSAGCRAIWCGSGTAWTTGGEGFGVKLSSGLVTGTAYSFSVTYVSHGTGSTGAFNPIVYTNSTPAIGGVSLGNLTAVGTNWTTNLLNFTATAAQNGHTWLIIGTWSSLSSGFVNAFCSTCNQAVLPIELIYFDVKLNTTRQVDAKWSTATEKDHRSFVLQHSTDAEHFEDIETISGKGNSEQTQNYSSTDKKPYSGISYYRLKLVSTEGVVSYTELRSVDLDHFSKLKLYPNPTNGVINIPVMENQIAFSELAEMEVLNFYGQSVMKTAFVNNLDVSVIPAGYYHLKIKNPDGETFIYKFSKQ
jgi:hypothetical protein